MTHDAEDNLTPLPRQPQEPLSSADGGEWHSPGLDSEPGLVSGSGYEQGWSESVDGAWALAGSGSGVSRSRGDGVAVAPRVLVLAWCMWLLGSWLITLSGEVSQSSARRMLYACLIGMMAVWPALRLSEAAGVESGGVRWWSVRQTLADWVSLYGVFQLLPWSLKISLEWSVSQVLWLDAAVGAWTFLTAAVVAWGRAGVHAGRRTSALGVCLGLLLAEPLVMWLSSYMSSGAGVWRMRLSPLEAVWWLSQPRASWQAGPWMYHVMSVGVGGVMLWLLLFWWAGRGEGEQEGRGSDGGALSR